MVYSMPPVGLDHLVVDIAVLLRNNPNSFMLANGQVYVEEVHRNRQLQVHIFMLLGFYCVKG